MNKSRQKGWLNLSTDRTVLLAACVCAAFCLLIGFSRTPHLYPIDFGQYEAILRQCGLTWTEEDMLQGGLQYERPIRFFSYTRFSWSSLFTPGAGGSTVYGTALVRLLTQPFGLDFSVDALSLVWALMLCIAAGLMTQALYRRGIRAWCVPGLILAVLFMNGNFCAMFRGLYPEAAAVVFSLLCLASALQAWSLNKEQRSRWLFPTLLLSVLAVKSLSPLLVFLPLVLAGNLWLLLSCRRHMKSGFLAAFFACLLLWTGLRSAVQLTAQDADYFSQASLYEASFNTLLPHAERPEEILAEWGLDASYAADAGKSYYLPEDAYNHNPRNPEEAARLFSHLSPGRLVQTYFRHPSLFFRAIQADELSMSRGFENPRNSAFSGNEKGFVATRVDGVAFSILWRMLAPSWTAFMALHLALSAACIMLAIVRRQRICILTALFSLGSLLFLPFALVTDGYAQSQEYMLFQVMLTLGLMAVLLIALFEVLPVFGQWLLKYTETSYPAPPDRLPPGYTAARHSPALSAVRHGFSLLSGNRTLVVLFTGLYCCTVLACILLPSTHPVSINNGDFGRMMEQMDITWSGMDYFNTANQANHRAIEEFAYTKPFDILKLTPLKPTYSLYWFAAIVRLLTQPFGSGFSTYLLAWVMSLISIICILILVHDLYAILGRSTVAAAALLCAMLMNETYLTWYNALYGEGCILLGLLLSLTCAVHLCVMPRGRGWKPFLWIAGLVLSLNILITAKAQMLLAVPGAVILILALSFYHRPYRYDLQLLQGILCLALCAVMAFSSLGVYQTDRTEDSVSQRHTMWQAYFYGIFMISDDPIGDMEALGVDTAMAPDIGKYVDFSDDSLYVYAPLSDEAEEAFYRHVSMGTILAWYITHPGKLWYMLDHAAQESQNLYSSFRIYKGQDYSHPSHDTVNGWNLWPAWRSWLTPGIFLGYVLFYGVLLFLLLRRLLRKDASPRERVLACIPLFLMVTGVLQFPLSVLGNGFADNQKQLFCFSLCHDFLLAGTLLFLCRYLRHLTHVPDSVRIWLKTVRSFLHEKDLRRLWHPSGRGQSASPGAGNEPL